jgi:hypothetical protein
MCCVPRCIANIAQRHLEVAAFRQHRPKSAHRLLDDLCARGAPNTFSVASSQSHIHICEGRPKNGRDAETPTEQFYALVV